MTKERITNVTMRIRLGQNEFEVTGPSDFVEKKIADFIEQNKQNSTSIPTSGQTAIHQVSEGLPTFSGKSMSAAQFFKKVNPHTDTDRTLAAGYYLELVRKMENFTAADIKDIIKKEAKTPPPRNPNETINKNIKKGYMMSAGDKEGKMAFVLTSDGEEAIRTLLEQ